MNGRSPPAARQRPPGELGPRALDRCHLGGPGVTAVPREPQLRVERSSSSERARCLSDRVLTHLDQARATGSRSTCQRPEADFFEMTPAGQRWTRGDGATKLPPGVLRRSLAISARLLAGNSRVHVMRAVRAERMSTERGRPVTANPRFGRGARQGRRRPTVVRLRSGRPRAVGRRRLLPRSPQGREH
jgi:hypothetical protein